MNLLNRARVPPGIGIAGLVVSTRSCQSSSLLSERCLRSFDGYRQDAIPHTTSQTQVRQVSAAAADFISERKSYALQPKRDVARSASAASLVGATTAPSQRALASAAHCPPLALPDIENELVAAWRRPKEDKFIAFHDLFAANST
jgi:hypothetical protein